MPWDSVFSLYEHQERREAPGLNRIPLTARYMPASSHDFDVRARSSLQDAPKQADQDDELVTVRRQRYDSGKTARVSLADLKDIHFRSDGRRCAAVGELAKVGPRLCLHARVRCDRIVDGKLHHSCRYSPPPHEMLVFIIQKDNDGQLYRRLLERVETPRARRRKRTGSRTRPTSRRLARLLRKIAN